MAKKEEKPIGDAERRTLPSPKEAAKKIAEVKSDLKEETEWTVLFLEVREVMEPAKSGPRGRKKRTLELHAKVGKGRDTVLRSGEGGVDLPPPTVFDLMVGQKHPPIVVKDRGKARIYIGGAVVGFAWMADRPPPARFLRETAEKAASWHSAKLIWDGEEPK